MTVTALLGEIADVGRDGRRGGYSRHGFAPVEGELRTWFVEQAQRRGLDVRTDRNGNLWAWWGTPGPNAVITGSHLDSVPGGGAFDGPLGVAASLSAVDLLRSGGFQPGRPLAIGVFSEEEGGRFGVPCLGSRLMTGSLDPDAARRLTDSDGITLAEAASSAGVDPARFGRDDEALADIGCFVELHVEQGRAMDLLDDRPSVAVASSILAHGRWRFTVTGVGNHAGTTEVPDRRDPMLPAAAAVLAARRALGGRAGARATVGRLTPTPGGTNVIASSVDFWLDARAPEEAPVREVVEEITAAARAAAAEEGCELSVRQESFGDTVLFDPALRDRLAAELGGVPVLPTGAGHDAGILASRVPTAMLFVRNPTGISHAPAEHAEPADCEAGAAALARTLESLCRDEP
ncbi:allantoate amidohydrolase [Pseudonocardia spinosispora]|uniref:allantoate amidohydrolase n=1 Tax=Pseudonocardia spinosispora TaxID=103441 RepID=UPI00048E0754|nr:allantoate amidohydrolase [Pseudonocardia spinosispora]